jgi:hypothetical protein
LHLAIDRPPAGLQYAVKWRNAYCGLPKLGWIIEMVAYDVSVNVVFFGGAEFDPPPPLGDTDRSRYVKVKTLEETQEPENLGWAIGYNSLALPLAAGLLAPLGLTLRPEIAAILMAGSSLLVAVNAPTLKRLHHHASPSGVTITQSKLAVTNPDGTTLVPSGSVYTSGKTRSFQLAATGLHTILVNPVRAYTGSIALVLR